MIQSSFWRGFLRREHLFAVGCKKAPLIPTCLGNRRFSATPKTRIMEMSGFSPEQITVRESISKICSNFPDVS